MLAVRTPEAPQATCTLARPAIPPLGRPRYPVFVHRAAGLLHASFRPHLAVTRCNFKDCARTIRFNQLPGLLHLLLWGECHDIGQENCACRLAAGGTGIVAGGS